MNRALLIIFVPALLVVTGYLWVFRFMGVAPGYPRLVLVLTILFGAIYWLSRKKTQRGGTRG